MLDRKELLPIISELGFTWRVYDIIDPANNGRRIPVCDEVFKLNEIGYLALLPKEIFQIVLDYLRNDLNHIISIKQMIDILNESCNKYWLIGFDDELYFCRKLMNSKTSEIYIFEFDGLNLENLLNGIIRIKLEVMKTAVWFIKNNACGYAVSNMFICSLYEIPTKTKFGNLIHEQIIKKLCYKFAKSVYMMVSQTVKIHYLTVSEMDARNG